MNEVNLTEIRLIRILSHSQTMLDALATMHVAIYFKTFEQTNDIAILLAKGVS